jgi:hypothetical protein
MSQRFWPAIVALLLVVRAEAARWPPFAPARESLTPGVAASIEQVWANPTLVRAVEIEPATVPLGVYAAFIDVPDVTAAAARRLGLAKYEVYRLDDGWYEADDHDGADGVYHVVSREGGRRVVLSWGSHRSAFLGTIRGSALTLVELEDRSESTGQRLTAYVLIDNPLAAVLARVLVTVFGSLADRKLTEGLAVASQVAAWAMTRPAEFCDWLQRSALPVVSRERVQAVLPECGSLPAASGPPAP